MKSVFSLREELEKNPQRVEKTQALALNTSKPTMGLSGRYGLFGSHEWWGSITDKKMPLQRLSGVIVRAYVAGQDPDDINTVDIRMANGEVQPVGIYLNDKADLPLFQIGHLVYIVYALDELKLQPAQDGGVNVSKIALEMMVSMSPVVNLPT
ncbi:MAG: hypothetical protein JF606_25925 [Burkholderiales bacterium]|jgi:hypothetical protein|nr:hypothetical protein [Burkholderiales bacterium]